MATNFVKKGEHIDWTAPTGGVVSGTAYLMGTILGVALVSASATESVSMGVKGVWTLPKLSTDVITVGARLYWDNSNKRLTTSATGNTLAGYAASAAGNGATTVDLAINAAS